MASVQPGNTGYSYALDAPGGVDVNTVPGIRNTGNLEVAYPDGVAWDNVKGWKETSFEAPPIGQPSYNGDFLESEFIPNPDYVPPK